MKCNKTELQLIDYIYGEMTPDDSASFEKHLTECSKCRSEVAELRHSRDLLRSVPDVYEGMSRIPVRSSFLKELTALLPSGIAGRIGFGIAAGLLVLLLIGSLARLRIHYSGGNLDIRMGSSAPGSHAITAVEEQKIINRINQQNFQVLNTWLQNFRDEQNTEIKQVLTDYSYALQSRQDQQFRDLGKVLQQFYNHTDQRFKQTDLVLNDLIQTTK